MSMVQLILVILGATVWLVGGNILMAAHERRVGEPWFKTPFRKFNAKEWVILGLLTAVSFSLLITALNLSQ